MLFASQDICCTESNGGSCQTDLNTEPRMKQRKVGGQRPLLSSGVVSQFKLCTYCGVNMAEGQGDKAKKVNAKRHWATNHAIQLCHEMGAKIDDEKFPVSPIQFMKHLDAVDHVFNSLNSHNYKIVPACTFLENK